MILNKSEVSFFFFENNELNANILQSEINQLGQLPDKINCSLMCDDYQKQLSDRIDTLEKTGGKLSPTFAFIDPYGYSISMELLNRLLSFKHCELFINFMYRYVDMAMHDKSKASNMDELFGTYLWQELLDIEDPDDRLSNTIRLFGDQLHAGYVTSTVMRGERNQVKYVLIHASNSFKARDTMKEAIWSVIPDGSFTAYERDNPGQLVLISPDPDLRYLESIIWKNFHGKNVRMEEIYEVVDSTLYLRKHIHKIIKNYLDKNRVTASGYTGRFAFSNNPIIEFPAELF
jgi:three-Cys-motif partner protein